MPIMYERQGINQDLCVWHYFIIKSLRNFRAYSISLKWAYYNEKYFLKFTVRHVVEDFKSVNLGCARVAQLLVISV